ncbi:MAG: tRNA pseudouridine(38-40) synthase TruA [Candidatus Acidiferrales bacterium]
MQNIKLTLAYDGTDFHGWQTQPGQSTIQSALSDVVGRITQEHVTVHAAGRTDAGVHALGQVAHFRAQSSLAPEEFQRALNALLPREIRVVAAESAAPDFHARWQALAKTYCYRVYRGRVLPPFLWRYVLHDPFPLDFDAMSEAAQLFEGAHDFTSFAASTGSEEDDRDRTVERVIFRSEVLRGDDPNLPSAAFATLGITRPGPDEWVYVVRGRSFLRYMVRKLSGTLIDVGRGRLSPADVIELFALRDRSRSGPTLPPQGLFLVSVEYPDAAASIGPAEPLEPAA